VLIKIDLVGPTRRGLALGLNEASGYLAVAGAALVTGQIAERAGLRPAPFFLGLAIAGLGFGLSAVFVRESRGHAAVEAGVPSAPGPPRWRSLAWRTSVADRTLASASQAGFVNNLNDGLAWGLLPIVQAAAGLSIAQIGLLAAAYPATWGLTQIATGALSDRLGRKWLIVGGMLLQAAALASIATWTGFEPWLLAAIVLGLGTAMVYPTLIAVIADVTHPSLRGATVGVYRFWRDLGFAVGAILVGLLADRAGATAAIGVVAALTAASGLVVAARMRESHPIAQREVR
jgi:predicted MFS family arabinose efflux permease